jgi:hypothetical protein
MQGGVGTIGGQGRLYTRVPIYTCASVPQQPARTVFHEPDLTGAKANY